MVNWVDNLIGVTLALLMLAAAGVLIIYAYTYLIAGCSNG